MFKETVLVLLVVARIYTLPAMPVQHTTPDTGCTPSTTTTIIPANPITLTGDYSQNRFTLHWQVEQNETADMFEVEKSTDGIHFSMAALVFGTDTPDTGRYEFFEKNKESRVTYRIRLISKNKEVRYSDAVEIARGA